VLLFLYSCWFSVWIWLGVIFARVVKLKANSGVHRESVPLSAEAEFNSCHSTGSRFPVPSESHLKFPKINILSLTLYKRFSLSISPIKSGCKDIIVDIFWLHCQAIPDIPLHKPLSVLHCQSLKMATWSKANSRKRFRSSKIFESFTTCHVDRNKDLLLESRAP